MPRVYELPTHLDVQDTLLFGLTARQLVRLAVGASVAYAIWNQTALLPVVLRAGLTVGAVIFGLLLALLPTRWQAARSVAFRGTPVLPSAASAPVAPQLRIAVQPAKASGGWADLQLEPAWIAVRRSHAPDEHGRRHGNERHCSGPTRDRVH